MEQRGAMEAVQALEQRSDEELEAETKYKSAALAILGARASERFDADAARSYFQRAIAAAREAAEAAGSDRVLGGPVAQVTDVTGDPTGDPAGVSVGS